MFAYFIDVESVYSVVIHNLDAEEADVYILFICLINNYYPNVDIAFAVDVFNIFFDLASSFFA